MTNVITIEKNVPIPESRSVCQTTTKYDFIQNMEIGDSFVVDNTNPDINPKLVRGYVYGLKHKRKDNGREYVIRTLSGNSKRPNKIRVWRTK